MIDWVELECCYRFLASSLGLCYAFSLHHHLQAINSFISIKTLPADRVCIRFCLVLQNHSAHAALPRFRLGGGPRDTWAGGVRVPS